MRSNSPTLTAVVKHGHSRGGRHRATGTRSARLTRTASPAGSGRVVSAVQGDCAVHSTATAALCVAGFAGRAATGPHDARPYPGLIHWWIG